MKLPYLLFPAVVVVACGPGSSTVDAGPDGAPQDAYVADSADAGDGALPPIHVDKVDVLFAIDNSASMGDKQALVANAVAGFIGRLVNPHCVDTSGKSCTAASDCTSLGAGAACDVYGHGGAGQCFVPGDSGGVNQCGTIPNTKPEFTPVHDMHIGIVSSSLGGGGSPDICVPTTGDPTHQDDKGHLLNRTVMSAGPPVVEGSIANAKPIDGSGGSFLAWLPGGFPQNVGKQPPNVTPYLDPGLLVPDFQALVSGVQQHGCGLEAQLESWYRFLVQPDPWDTITLDSNSPPAAHLTNIDTTLLKMRHDFLRSDSLVAIIQVTDEEDSWSDPLWRGGFGWVARTMQIPGGPGQGAAARGTSECDAPVTSTTGPNDPDCVSCMFSGNKPVAKTPISADPNCTACAGGTTMCPKAGWYTPAAPSVPIAAADGVNVRYSRQIMRQKYGYDNQFDYHRYVDALTSSVIPSSANEPHDPSVPYNPTRNCENPLFGRALPDGSDTTLSTLCNLAPGSRTPDMIFYETIGGVPNELLDDTGGNLKLSLNATDWAAIVGQDPDHYVFTGMDPHMVQSTAPRATLQAPGTTYMLGTDPINGREWNTLTASAAIDLEYACTFALSTVKDCTAPVNTGTCDCVGAATTAHDGPPLCDPTTRTNQIRGKVYPQSRFQLVAKALGSQAVVASLCAKVTTGSTTSPSYGYNPAMQAFIDKMQPVLQR